MTRPAPPSPRVWTAAGLAATIGAATFLIWWGTAPRAARDPAPAAADPPQAQIVIPRGGTLRGAVTERDIPIATAVLTQAALVRVNRSTDQVEPWLAESWTVSSDSLTYKMKLRAGVLWHDGSALTADDVASSIEAAGAALQMDGQPMHARALGPLEVEVVLPRPFAPALRLLDEAPILPRRNAQGGLGPFRIAVDDSKKAGRRSVEFERNPRYWRTAPDGKPFPYLNKVVLEIVPDASGELQALLGGTTDYVDAELRPEEYATLKRADQDGKALLYDMGPGLDVDALTAGPGSTWFAREDFRLAISEAINRREFCEAVYEGACDPSSVPVSPGNATWFLADLPTPGSNASRARTLLAELGLRDRNGDGMLDEANGRPVTIRMLVDDRSASARGGAAFVTEALKKVGVAVSVVEGGAFDVAYRRIEFRDTDPAIDPGVWVQQDAADDWQKKLNDLMAKQAAAGDKVDRLQLFADAQKIYAQHMPAIALGAPYVYVATSPRVMNAKPSRLRPPLLWNAEQLAVREAR